MRNETRGAVFKKQQFITVCYSTCVHIEMKQEGQFSKKKKTQFITVCYSTRGAVFKKIQQYYYYCMIFNLCAYWNETRGTVSTRGAVFKKKNTNLLQYAIQLVCVLKWNKRDSFQQKKNTNLLQYAIQLVCILKWNKMDSFQKNPINDNMLLNLCAKWNKRGSFQKTTIYYSMIFNLCPYWNETRWTVFKKKQKKLQFITVCYSTCVHIEMKQDGQFSKKKHKFIRVCYSTCVRIEMKQEGQFSKKKNTNLLQYAIQLVCILKWNKMDSFQKNPINDNMLLNLCAKWNKRGSFQKTTIYYIMYQQEGQFSKNNNLLQYAIQLVCVLEWNKRGSFQKNPTDDNMLLNSWGKRNKRGNFQKTTIYYIMKWNKRGSFQKTTIYYSMLFNLCPYWNETRWTVFKKKQKKLQFITVCYSTCVHIEMKQDGQFSKKSNQWQYATKLVCEMKQEGQFSKNNNLLLYAIQLVCVLKWNKRDSFQKKKTPIYYSMLNLLHIEMKQEGQFSKNNNLLQYAIQLVCILKWNKRGSFQKNPIDDNMLFVFKKQQFITCREKKQEGQFSKNNNLLHLCVCSIQLVCWTIEMKQEGQFSKNNNLLQYAIQLVCILKWNKMDSFQKNPINDNMLLNLCAKWNKRGSFQKTTIYYSMLFNLCAYWNETRCYSTRQFQKKKQQFITVCYSTCVRIEMKQEGQFSKKTQFITVCYSTCVRIEMKQEGQFSKKKHQFITVCYSTCMHIEMKQDGQFSKKSN